MRAGLIVRLMPCPAVTDPDECCGSVTSNPMSGVILFFGGFRINSDNRQAFPNLAAMSVMSPCRTPTTPPRRRLRPSSLRAAPCAGHEWNWQAGSRPQTARKGMFSDARSANFAKRKSPVTRLTPAAIARRGNADCLRWRERSSIARDDRAAESEARPSRDVVADEAFSRARRDWGGFGRWPCPAGLFTRRFDLRYVGQERQFLDDHSRPTAPTHLHRCLSCRGHHPECPAEDSGGARRRVRGRDPDHRRRLLRPRRFERVPRPTRRACRSR